MHEGGIATPLVVHWPARIKAKGELRHQPGHLIDIMATCVDVSGAKYPALYQGSTIKPLEGKSLVPAFAGEPIEREALYWEHEGNRAVRVGTWKLVAKFNRRQAAWGPWELYDMKADRSELNDLAARHPERVTALAGRWEAYATRATVYPSKKPGHKPKKKKNRKQKKSG